MPAPRPGSGSPNRGAVQGALRAPGMRGSMENEHQQQLLSRLITYVPFHWVRRGLENPVLPRPASEWRHGAVLAAELLGLGPLAEHANRLGADGADELCRLLNLGLAAILEQAIFPQGGQLVRLGGEQVLAFFVGESALARAAQAGLEIHGALARSGPRLGGIPALALRAAVAKGPMYLAQIGDPAERMEVVLAGPAVVDALSAVTEARGGELVIPAAQAEASSAIGIAAVRGAVAAVAAVDPAPAPVPIPDFGPDLGEQTVAKINALRPFVGPELFDRLLADPAVPPPPPQLKRATVLLAEFWHIDPARTTSRDEFNRRFLLANRIVQRHGGQLARLDFTAKGRKLTAVFGLPESRGTDEERALGCALELREALGSVRMRAAVNTGFLFSGEVGSALKREQVILGAPVQVASRLLAAADEGAIVAGPETCRGGGAGFELGPVWQVRIPGTRAPVTVRAVLRRQDRIRQAVAPGRLAGRARELESALKSFEWILRDGGGALVVRADQGSGKTRFLRELVALARTRARVGFKRLRCSYLTRERPFALVEACLQALTGESRPLAAWVEEVPELMESQLKALGELATLNGRADYVSLQQRLAVDALAVLGNRPKSVLVLDDLHEADPESLAVFRELARTQALSFLASSGEPLEGFPELHLPPLDATGLADLTREALGEAPPALVNWLEHRSAGNVLQARALLAWLIESDALEKGPAGISLRAPGLEPTPAALKLPVAYEVYPAGQTESGPTSLDSDPGLVTDPGAPPPGADGVALAAHRRRHRELAELIESVPGASEERREELAILYGESDRAEKAVYYARTAAKAALARNRYGLALSWTEAAARSAQLVDDPALIREVRVEEAEAWHRLYDPHRAAAIAREVEASAAQAGDAALAERAALLVAQALADGYAPGAEEACHAVLIRAEPGSLAEAQARLSLARVLRGRGELPEAEQLVERASVLAAAGQDEELRIHALIESALLRAEKGELPRARAALETAATLSRPHALARARVLVLLNLGVVRAHDADVPGAAQAYHDAERLAVELGLVIPRAAALVNLSDLHRDAGDREQAWTFANLAQVEARRAGDARVAGAAALTRALSAGPEVDAVSIGAEALRQLEPLEDASLFIEAAARLAHMALDRGERQWAVQLFTAARARAEATGIARHQRALDRLDSLLHASMPRVPVAAREDAIVTAPGV